MTEPAALAVSSVSHCYGERRALDDVSFAVAPGMFAVLLGLNGAGKSTLFALVTRLYDTAQGSIAVFGHDVRRAPGEALRRLGVVFQNRTLDLDLTIGQNLDYHASLHGMAKADGRARAHELLAQFELGDRLKDKVRSLSGGQMRRVEIVRALIHRPRLLLLDEATVGLDIKSRADIEAHVRGLVARERIGVLWATHLIDEVGGDDTVIVLHQGRLLADGIVRRVAEQTGTESIRAAFTKLTGTGKPMLASEAA